MQALSEVGASCVTRFSIFIVLQHSYNNSTEAAESGAEENTGVSVI